MLPTRTSPAITFMTRVLCGMVTSLIYATVGVPPYDPRYPGIVYALLQGIGSHVLVNHGTPFSTEN